MKKTKSKPKVQEDIRIDMNKNPKHRIGDSVYRLGDYGIDVWIVDTITYHGDDSFGDSYFGYKARNRNGYLEFMESARVFSSVDELIDDLRLRVNNTTLPNYK